MREVRSVVVEGPAGQARAVERSWRSASIGIARTHLTADALLDVPTLLGGRVIGVRLRGGRAGTEDAQDRDDGGHVSQRSSSHSNLPVLWWTRVRDRSPH